MAKAREVSRSAAIRSRRHGLTTLPILLPPLPSVITSGVGSMDRGVHTGARRDYKPQLKTGQPRIYVELHSLSSAGTHTDNNCIYSKVQHSNSIDVSFTGPCDGNGDNSIETYKDNCDDNFSKANSENNGPCLTKRHYNNEDKCLQQQSVSIESDCGQVDTEFINSDINKTFQQNMTSESTQSIMTFAQDGLDNGLYFCSGGVSYSETLQSCSLAVQSASNHQSLADCCSAVSESSVSAAAKTLYLKSSYIDETLLHNKYSGHNTSGQVPKEVGDILAESMHCTNCEEPPCSDVRGADLLTTPNHTVAVHCTLLLQSRAQQPTMKIAAASVTASVAAALSPKLAKTAMFRSGGGMKSGAPEETVSTGLETRLHRRLDQRELRATVRMAFVISLFCIMWIGFFVVYVVRGLCPVNCYIPRQLDAFFFWLGYSNSSVNPILYTLFNDEFRKAFEKILCSRCSQRSKNGRGRNKIKRRNNRFLKRPWIGKLNR